MKAHIRGWTLVQLHVQVQVQYRRSSPETVPPGPCTVAAALGGCHGALGRSSASRKDMSGFMRLPIYARIGLKIYQDLGGFREMPGGLGEI